jgi:hypothetical protein
LGGLKAMQLGGIEHIGAGITLAVMEGKLERRTRRESYRTIVKSISAAHSDTLLIDKSQLPKPGAFDLDYADWDHDGIAEDLRAVGVRKIAVVDAAGRDDLSGYLVMALRRCGIAVLAAQDLKAALTWLRAD